MELCPVESTSTESSYTDQRLGVEDENRTSLTLIGLANSNDTAAWRRLVDLYSPMVYHWCKESGLPPADLQDVFQDVFYALSRSLGKFRSIDDGTFRGWLRTLTRNKVNDHFRRIGRESQAIGGTDAIRFFEQVPVVEPSTLSSIHGLEKEERQIQNVMLRQALESIRSCFSGQTWTAFWMVVVDGREAIDVAKDLAMRPGTVRVAKSRVLKRLRLEMGEKD